MRRDSVILGSWLSMHRDRVGHLDPTDARPYTPVPPEEHLAYSYPDLATIHQMCPL